MSSTVSSPATVPMTRRERRGRSRRRGTGGAGRRADHDEVRRAVDADEELLGESRGRSVVDSSPGAVSAPRRVDQVTDVAAQLTAPSSSRSRDSVAWVTVKPSREQLRELRLRADVAGAPSASTMRRCRAALVCGTFMLRPACAAARIAGSASRNDRACSTAEDQRRRKRIDVRLSRR